MKNPKTKASKNKFGIGRAGIEFRYYLIHGYRNSTERTDDQGKPVPSETLRIGADSLDDLMQHLKRFEADFDVMQIKLIGMMRCVSGTAYYG